MTLNTKIFISYCSKDETIVDKICKILYERHIVFILDKKDFKSDEFLPKEIRNKIEDSSHFLVILSNHSITSNWVKLELNHAESLHIRGKIKLMAMNLDSVTLPDEIESQLINVNKEPIFSNSIEQNIGDFLEKNSHLVSNIASVKENTFGKGKEFANHLSKAQIEILSVQPQDYLTQKKLVWMVVPRTKITLIHLAQIKLIKYLLKNSVDWTLIIIYNDLKIYSSSEYKLFDQQIREKLIKDEIGTHSSFFLTEYLLDIETRELLPFSKEFIKLSKDITVEKTSEIFHKKYSEADRVYQEKGKVINLIRPLFAMTFASYFAKKHTDLVFLAGLDEKDQWTYSVNTKNFG